VNAKSHTSSASSGTGQRHNSSRSSCVTKLSTRKYRFARRSSRLTQNIDPKHRHPLLRLTTRTMRKRKRLLAAATATILSLGWLRRRSQAMQATRKARTATKHHRACLGLPRSALFRSTSAIVSLFLFLFILLFTWQIGEEDSEDESLPVPGKGKAKAVSKRRVTSPEIEYDDGESTLSASVLVTNTTHYVTPLFAELSSCFIHSRSQSCSQHRARIR
jgi:hypothetical protein